MFKKEKELDIVGLSEEGISIPEHIILIQVKEIGELITMAKAETLYHYKDCLYLLPNNDKPFISFSRGYAEWKKNAEHKS